ncbi:class I SAM-dependent methyltransferase [Pontibacter burrus]|uniref:Class I SAM-dependent methyltransferase n=1 Tax=Pontibacter burrus TaxID=2704466 RepID=A0A6B3LUP0_9BACT|nr:class I SAM-dependent methyltransferase [Pontibacter burrus]NEM97230.1 class I SAM-dependent methyltransferase [Pontibacter burrus]
MERDIKPQKAKADDIYSKDFVSGLFDSMAATYGVTNYFASFGFAERWRHQFIKQLPDHPYLEVGYDMMTGMGEVWASFDNRFKGAEIIALDISPVMLAKAEKRLHKYELTITVDQVDVLANSIPDNSADFIVSSFGLKTFNKVQLGMLADEVARILRPDGVFSFVEISVPQNVLKPFYMFYLKHAIPVIGKLFQGNAENYRMLGKYTAKFKDCRLFHDLLSERGLDVKYNSYFYGCATGVSGRKL